MADCVIRSLSKCVCGEDDEGRGETWGKGGRLHLLTHYTFHVHSDAPIWSVRHLTKSPRRGERARRMISTTFNLLHADADVHNSSSDRRTGCAHLELGRRTAGCDGTADPLISFNSKCSRLPCIFVWLPALFLLVITCLVYQCVSAARCDLCHVYFLHAVRGITEVPVFSYLEAQHVRVSGIYRLGEEQRVCAYVFSRSQTKLDVFIY